MQDDQAPPAPVPSDQPVLDSRVLADLREILEDDVDAIVAEYLKDAPRLVSEASDALAGGDMTSLRRAVHSLKSTSAAVGAQALSWVCARLESATRDGDTDVIATYMPLLAGMEAEAAAAIDRLGR